MNAPPRVRCGFQSPGGRFNAATVFSERAIDGRHADPELLRDRLARRTLSG